MDGFRIWKLFLVINRITEFDGVIAYSSQNPSRKFSFLDYHSFNFWQLGALILAFVATFSRIKIFITRFHRHIFPVYEPLISYKNDEVLSSKNDDSDGSDDDEDVASSLSFDESDEENDGGLFEYEDYNVAGSDRCNGFYEDEMKNEKFGLRRRKSGAGEGFSWSEFTSGKSVVKLWDGFGLGLDLNRQNGKSLISIYDLCNDEIITSFPGTGGACNVPAFTCSSPGVFFSAGVESSKNLALKVWDARVGCRFPAILADLGIAGRNDVGINAGGVYKVYVRDDVNDGLTVIDTRNVNKPLKNVTESNECEDDLTSALLCHDAVLPYWI